MRKRFSIVGRHSIIKLENQNNDKLEEELHKPVKTLEEELHLLYTRQAKLEHIQSDWKREEMLEKYLKRKNEMVKQDVTKIFHIWDDNNDKT